MVPDTSLKYNVSLIVFYNTVFKHVFKIVKKTFA